MLDPVVSVAQKLVAPNQLEVGVVTAGAYLFLKISLLHNGFLLWSRRFLLARSEDVCGQVVAANDALLVKGQCTYGQLLTFEYVQCSGNSVQDCNSASLGICL